MTIEITHPDSGVLIGLGLTQRELNALMKQGFVSSEYRYRNRKKFGPYYKVRFRLDGRQRVKYLGRDFVRASAVSSALERCRLLRRLRVATGKRLQVALQILREARRQLEPALVKCGIGLHGYAERRCGRAKSPQNRSNSPTAKR